MSEDETRSEQREFLRSFQRFLDALPTAVQAGLSDNEVVRLVRDFLGDDGIRESVVTRELPPFEHVNLQTALDAWSVATGRDMELRGVSLPPNWGPVSLQSLVSGDPGGPVRLSAPALVDRPNGPGSTLGCLKFALLLVTEGERRYVLLVTGPGQHSPTLQVEVAGLSVDRAQEVLGDLDRLRDELNVYRGHLLDVAMGPGGLSLLFVDPPRLARADVVLPAPVLSRIERHALAVAEHRAELLAAGQHLKRGLLLYGPPGTGKTHTVRYLTGAMTGYTRFVLTGRLLHAVGEITGLARVLEPAVVVLEDVDLVAEDRSFGPGASPVLFELLDAMDGAAPDADLLFLLTTNRADLLEPALAARPGRVDVAVEIGLPDAEARAALLEVYGRRAGLRLSDDERDVVVARSEGVTASFLKELVRRAVLESLVADGASPAGGVSATHVERALDDLLDSTQGVTRTLLGMGGDDVTPASPGVGRVHRGWMAYAPHGSAYTSSLHVESGPA